MATSLIAIRWDTTRGASYLSSLVSNLFGRKVGIRSLMNLNLVLQELVVGLATGSIYALIALGYTMVYGIIELINFAHGDIFMLGLMVSLTILIDFGLTKTLHGWELAVFLPLILVGTMIITGLINLAVDRIAYRPLRRAPRLVPLISAIGVSF